MSLTAPSERNQFLDTDDFFEIEQETIMSNQVLAFTNKQNKKYNTILIKRCFNAIRDE